MRRHTRAWKEQSLAELKQLSKKYSIVAIADIEGFPADLFQRIRKKLQGKAIVKVSKTSIIKKMVDAGYAKETKISDHAQRMCAIIFTQLSPFELFNLVKKNKGRTFARPGQLAPEDIMVPAGDTGLPPGPALAELKNAGLKVRMQGPTISVSEDTVVTKKGQPITQPVAAMLSKLNIKPIKVGLNITAILEGKILYLPVVLDIDEEQVFANFQRAYREAIALAMEIGYSTPETVKLLVQKGFREAKAVALEAKFETLFTPVEKAPAESAVVEK